MGKNKKSKKSGAKAPVLPSNVKGVNHLNGKSANYSANITNGKPVFTFTGASNRNGSVNGVDTEAINGSNGVSADLHIDLDSVDHSIIREPINIGAKNVRQIMSCVKDGTSEVKDIILNECNIIYECKICLSLFRSLANLIAHKRVYCKKHYCEQMLLFDSTVLHFNEDEEDICEEHDAEDEEVFAEEPNDSGNGTSIDFVSPVSSIEMTNSNENVENQKRKFMDNCYAKVANDKLKEEATKGLELQLSSIKTNSNAVFQSRFNGETSSVNDVSDKSVSNSGNKKDIITELLKEAKNDKTNCSDINDIQALKRQRLDEILTQCREDENHTNDKSIVKCEICGSTFTSTKTFKVHFRTIHSNNRQIYPCPLCSLTFKQLSNATRHIIQIHKRTRTQANTLREVMRRRAYYTNSSGNSSEVEDISEEDIDNDDSALNSAQLSVEYNDEEVTKIDMQLIENGTDKSKEKTKSGGTRTMTPCIYNCGNIFNWAPAKRSHEKSCRKRFASSDDCVIVKPVYETNGNSVPLSATAHNSRSTPPPPPLIKQNSFSSESVIKNESIFQSSNVNINSSNSVAMNSSNQDLHSISNHSSSATTTATATTTSTSTTTTTTCITNIALPNRIEEQIKQFTDVKSLQCTLCPTHDFMNLNHLVQHAVAHIGYNVFRCHGCSFHSIVENDMKSHLKNNHNIGEDMLSKHYQTLPTLNQPRLLIVPVKARKSINGPNSNPKPIAPIEPIEPIEHGMNEVSNNRDQDSKLLKIHLRTMGNTSKKIYEIVDK